MAAPDGLEGGREFLPQFATESCLNLVKLAHLLADIKRPRIQYSCGFTGYLLEKASAARTGFEPVYQP